MNVQGTRFHLLSGRGDWAGCEVRTAGRRGPLGPEWDAHHPTELEWDEGTGALRLTRAAPLFRKASPSPPLPLDRRRGAGRDRYGNWYWIDANRRGIRFLAAPARRSVPWWTGGDLSSSCATAAAGDFAECAPEPPADLVLQGLAVTSRHYLAAGWWSGTDPDDRGLLIFDLHQVGRPVVIRWPAGEPFQAWDLAPAPEGGLLVLDRVHRTWWRLDEGFRLSARVEADVADPFQPVDPVLARRVTPGRAHAAGYPLAVGSPSDLEVADPVSIAAGPEGTVLVLDSDPLRGFSVVHLVDGGTHLQSFSLERAVEVADPDLPDAEPQPYPVLAHDLAYQPEGEDTSEASPLPPPTLYLADRQGHQVLAFTIDRVAGRLVAHPDFLALRRWEAKALVAAGGQVFYDFADRFVALRSFPDCRYHRDATFTSPAAFSGPAPGVPPVPGQPFDSNRPGCVWHRLFLDAGVPPGTTVTVRARAADHAELLAQAPWRAQPGPYLRSGGCELAWLDPWADIRADDGSLPPGTGTWELLFQSIRGRYLQLEVTLAGTGRSTPGLRALRAWYPRFSYVEHYLPAAYQEEDGAEHFAERWLANFEGLFTEVEERMEHVSRLLDARTAPEDSLEWLACWFGIVLDPQWDEPRRRFLIRYAGHLFRLRGTLTGLLAMLRLFLDCEVSEELLEPAGAARSAGRVRVVESFLTRSVPSVSLGDPTAGGSSSAAPAPASLADQVAASAHRFRVLVPHDLGEDEHAMVRRLAEMNKPAHTQFELGRYWDLFRVGEARLGLDTQVGESARFLPLAVGQTSLPEGYLSAPYRFDVIDRLVSDRDRLGDLPAL